MVDVIEEAGNYWWLSLEVAKPYFINIKSMRRRP